MPEIAPINIVSNIAPAKIMDRERREKVLACFFALFAIRISETPFIYINKKAEITKQ